MLVPLFFMNDSFVIVGFMSLTFYVLLKVYVVAFSLFLTRLQKIQFILTNISDIWIKIQTFVGDNIRIQKLSTDTIPDNAQMQPWMMLIYISTHIFGVGDYIHGQFLRMVWYRVCQLSYDNLTLLTKYFLWVQFVIGKKKSNIVL